MRTVLLIGLGRFGRHIAEKLMELNVQVMAVDNREDRVNEALNLVTSAQIGDATQEAFLDTLGVKNFDVCIVAIGDNFLASLETTSLLKEMGAKTVVSRAARDVQAKFLRRNGADEVIYPEKQMAIWTAVCYSSDNIFDYIPMDDKHGIYEISVPKAWIGYTVGMLDIRKKYNVTVMATKDGDDLDLGIRPETVFMEQHRLLVLGTMENIQKLLRN